MYHFLSVRREGPITTITLNRPEVLNAVSLPMHFELQAALDAFAADESQHVGILTGAGTRAFCAGSDLKQDPAAISAALDRSNYPRCGYAGLIERFDLDKPLIAAVNGIAYGGGFEIALACDLVIAAETARFALPEPRVGMIAIGGGLHRLPRRIGSYRALELILTGRDVSAAEGLRLGFVNHVVPGSELSSAAQRWACQILANSPESVRASKEAVYRGLDAPTLAAALDLQARHPAFQRWRSSSNLLEGREAFVAGREPRWTQ